MDTKIKIKKQLFFMACMLGLIILPACEKDLTELNKDPNAFQELKPEFVFTNSQLSGAYPHAYKAHMMYGQAMQYYTTYFEVPAPGDKYFRPAGSHWGPYDGALRQNQDALRKLKENPEQNVNKISASRIWKVYVHHVITDQHGDVPYSEALQAQDDNIKPKYDTQEAIYTDMLNELEEAAEAFDPSKPTYGNADLFYGGDVGQWRKFAYSLMLRLGMRLSEIKPGMAETWVKNAIAGGPILEDQDIAKIPYTSGGTEAERNPKADFAISVDYKSPGGGNREGGKYAKTFIGHLKKTNDPRLSALSIVWEEDESAESGFVANSDPEDQMGMPIATWGRPENFNEFSEPNTNTVIDWGSPILVMTNAETYLTMAEAAIRGWYNGDAEEAYNNGVRAGMRQWALFGSEGEIPKEEIDDYLDENPYIGESRTFEEQLEQINTQKWATMFLDFYEVFSNWRRTGYPALTPTNYPGNITGGKIPRSAIYPDSELNLNEENFKAAMERQGFGDESDVLDRVWWDTEREVPEDNLYIMDGGHLDS